MQHVAKLLNKDIILSPISEFMRIKASLLKEIGYEPDNLSADGEFLLAGYDDFYKIAHLLSDKFCEMGQVFCKYPVRDVLVKYFGSFCIDNGIYGFPKIKVGNILIRHDQHYLVTSITRAKLLFKDKAGVVDSIRLDGVESKERLLRFKVA